MKLLKQFQVELAVLEKERQELCNAEKLFDLPITAYPGLVEVDREVGQFSKVLDLYEAQRVRTHSGTWYCSVCLCQPC